MSIKKYLSFVAFSHTLFAMPFAMIGFFLGVKANGGIVDWRMFLLVILCMVFARNSAMAFNRFADSDVDAENPRTSNREIPTGKIKKQEALLFIILNCVLFITTTFFINRICFYLSPVALLVVLGYSFTKRFTHYSHLFLGLGMSLAPCGAYLAVVGHFDWLPVFLSLIVIFWGSGFDVIYSLQDEKFDKDNHLFSIPVLMGAKNALRFSLLLHIICAALVFIIGWDFNFGWLYWLGATAFIFLLFFQHTLVSPGNLQKVNKAFFTTNGIASVVFASFVLMDIFLRHRM
jgi:4-hydroxybenzoate polyprenyltransferase